MMLFEPLNWNQISPFAPPPDGVLVEYLTVFFPLAVVCAPFAVVCAVAAATEALLARMAALSAVVFAVFAV